MILFAICFYSTTFIRITKRSETAPTSPQDKYSEADQGGGGGFGGAYRLPPPPTSVISSLCAPPPLFHCKFLEPPINIWGAMTFSISLPFWVQFPFFCCKGGRWQDYACKSTGTKCYKFCDHQLQCKYPLVSPPQGRESRYPGTNSISSVVCKPRTGQRWSFTRHRRPGNLGTRRLHLSNLVVKLLRSNCIPNTITEDIIGAR